MTENGIGILAASKCLPDGVREIHQIFEEEHGRLDAETARQLGIESVHLCQEETGSSLALHAARQAIETANIDPVDIDIIVDYSVLPQEYLVPAWNMSNKIQAGLGAKKSFTIGFSGAGSSASLVGLDFALATFRTDPGVNYVLLLGADVTIPANRLLNPDSPFTVLGDGASALLVGRNAPANHLIGSSIRTRGDYHDVCYIPGGGMVHPADVGLYRLSVDTERYRSSHKYEALKEAVEKVLKESGVAVDDLRQVILPNISAEDRREASGTLALSDGQISKTVIENHGHVQSNDLVFNFIQLLEEGPLEHRDPVLICSHGMGFTSAALLVRH